MLTVIKHANGEYSWTADGDERYDLKDKIYFHPNTLSSCPHCGQGLDDEDITIHNVSEAKDAFTLLVEIPRQHLKSGSAINISFDKDKMEYKEETEESFNSLLESKTDSHYKALAIELSLSTKDSLKGTSSNTAFVKATRKAKAQRRMRLSVVNTFDC